VLTRRRALILAGAWGATTLPGAGIRAQAVPRLLVLGGDLAEIVFALGAGDRIVATDDTALWPPEAAALPKVGYLRRLSAEGVLSLMPDLVLASPDAGPPGVLDQLRAAGLSIETAPEGQGFEAVAPKIAFVGRALGRETGADALAAQVTQEMAAVEAALESLPDRPSVLFLISVANGAPMASGSGTAADAMIRLAHARNAVEGFEGYKPLSAEAALGLAPEAVLLPDHAAAAAGGGAAALELAGLAQTPAGRAGRVVVMDGLKLLGFGPRTPQAVAELARALHPDAAARLKI
jgi:iron complex transport system substrate-binding protein